MRLYQAYVFDLDGTLYRGKEVLSHALETVTELQRRGAYTLFYTNNSTVTAEVVAFKLAAFGFYIRPEMVITSGMAAARHLHITGLQSAFVVGEEALRTTLAESGITLTETSPDALVVGLDRTFTYDVIKKAMHLLEPRTAFIATNTDAQFPIEGAGMVPGAGTLVAAIAACTGRDPYVVGKPNPEILLESLGKIGITPSETLVVGDRYETDILVGLRAGCSVHMVLSGVQKVHRGDVTCTPYLNGIL